MSRHIKVLHINSVNFGSTGSIMLNISREANMYGYISYVAYANSRTNKQIEVENNILIGSIIDRNLHLQLAYYTGLNGCFSNLTTKTFIRKLEEIKPEIIHLHNLHNCYINLKLLFDYIKEKEVKVVWTLHDCWAFTGQCPHFTMVQCEKWKKGCFECPQYNDYPASIVDRTKRMYSLKKQWFTGVKNLTIVTPSNWLAGLVSESFLGSYQIKVINNGIDLKLFKPTESDFRLKYGLQNKKIILGVSSIWNKSKGLDIFIELSKRLDSGYSLVLVGLSTDQIMNLPQNIIGLTARTSKELVEIYSAADWFVNPSMQETMGLVTVEALACGTPAIVSNLTAVPETVDLSCGVVAEEYNADTFYKILSNTSHTISKADCLRRASNYDMSKKYKEYIDLYNCLSGEGEEYEKNWHPDFS
ncbi:glycosyltransferase [Paenibacillus montanisoli]|uniref:Glycosyl transferase family 1 domain-containing protein n=1 Tax=Paenibacillus montanisoli TaxID=2081970 RepID=A0A328U255_9BACL|nr:glycosyltransferase [Paenibacillus montanisoli]RAP74006.1 hypothetical protein DL346_23305 [Paenibacillus montanisoli]